MKGCFLFFILIYFSLCATSQSGTLDTSFGNKGFVLTKIPGSSETHFEHSAIQNDGKIVAVGWAATLINDKTGYDFIVARYNSNGTLDGSFGTNGMVTTDFNGKGDFAYTVAIQGDGKIVVGGRTQELDGTASNVALVRYKTNGTLDASFGNKGKVVTTLSQDSEIKKILIQKDGKIIAVGFTQDVLLIRYNTDGQPDASFGNKGIVLTDFNSGYDIAVSAALQADDKIVVAGNVGTSVALARYKSDGSLDKGFGEQGKVITTLGKNLPQWSAITIQGKNIIVGGTVYQTTTDQGDFDFLLARYTANGTLDNSFGTGGIVYTDFTRNTDEAITSIAIQDNEKIVVGGGVSASKDGKITNFALARYNANGSLDESFDRPGIAGITRANLGASPGEKYYDYIYSINITANRLYCVGMNKLSNDNGNLESTQGIVAAYKIGNKNLSFTLSKTVATDKGLSTAVVRGIDPVFTSSGAITAVNFTMTGATTLSGRGSVSGQTFNKGVTTVTYKVANDPIQTSSFLVTVEDREAPVIANGSALPTVLSLNGKMQTVTVNYYLKDNGGSARAILSITSNKGSEADWKVVDNHHVQLRPSRADQTFTITITAIDRAGNTSNQKIPITVSH